MSLSLLTQMFELTFKRSLFTVGDPGGFVLVHKGITCAQ